MTHLEPQAWAQNCFQDLWKINRAGANLILVGTMLHRIGTIEEKALLGSWHSLADWTQNLFLPNWVGWVEIIRRDSPENNSPKPWKALKVTARFLNCNLKQLEANAACKAEVFYALRKLTPLILHATTKFCVSWSFQMLFKGSKRGSTDFILYLFYMYTLNS